ncbi:MAG: hypothetical protein P1P64_02975 [Treponemataceae bacterium]
MNNILEQFGKAILEYFKDNYKENSELKLSIDDYLFSHFAESAGLDENTVREKIVKLDTYTENSYIALAIATYQVKIAGDIPIDRFNDNGYYDKIRNNYPRYKDANNQGILDNYFCFQEELWKKVKTLFEDNHLTLILPDRREGAYRYVQYPISSRDLTMSELLSYADIFKEVNLMPNDTSMHYDLFCKKLENYFSEKDECYKRTVFNFYKIWDGRSRTNKSSVIATTDTQTKIVIELLENDILFYDEDSGKKIEAYNTINPYLFTGSNKIFFIKHNDDYFYSPEKTNSIQKSIL